MSKDKDTYPRMTDGPCGCGGPVCDAPKGGVSRTRPSDKKGKGKKRHKGDQDESSDQA